MSKQIAVLSDTHGLLRPEVLEKIAGCDLIIHGGDINRQEILDKQWAENIPETLTFQIEECRFFMVHNKKFVPEELTDIDVVIFGHSHKYVENYVDGRLCLNPGSCGRRRFDQEITFAMMTVDGKNISVEKVTVPH